MRDAFTAVRMKEKEDSLKVERERRDIQVIIYFKDYSVISY